MGMKPTTTVVEAVLNLDVLSLLVRADFGARYILVVT